MKKVGQKEGRYIVRKTAETTLVDYVLPVWSREPRARILQAASNLPRAIVAAGRRGAEDALVPRPRSKTLEGFDVHSMVEVPTKRPLRASAGDRTVRGDEAAHLRFARARTERDLVAFVRDFGPVLTAPCLPPHFEEEEGKVYRVPSDDVGAWEILEDLKKEQHRFDSVMRIITALKACTFMRGDVVEVARLARSLWGAGEPPAVPVGDEMEGLLDGDTDAAIEEGLLRDLLAFLGPFAFRPQVVRRPDRNRSVAVLGPSRQGQGFRQVLFGLALLELLGHGELRSCANRKCGSVFRPNRFDKLCCSLTCQKRAKADRAYKQMKKRSSGL